MSAMKKTPNALAQLLIDLQAGKKPSRWELHEGFTTTGIPSKLAAEIIAQAFPFPRTSSELYVAGVLWGSNHVPEEDYFHNLDSDGNAVPQSWGIRIIQDRRWIEDYFNPLRLKADAPDPKTGMQRLWTRIYPDGLMEAYFQQLGIGASRVNWSLIPEKERHFFVAGIIDSTPVVLSNNNLPDAGDYEGNNSGKELILDASNYGLAHTLAEGIPEASVRELEENPVYSPNSESWPYGVAIHGKGITWFLNKVRPELHFSLIKEEKQELARFEYHNKANPLTGKQLTSADHLALQKWIKKNWPVNSRDLANQCEAVINRSISVPTAWDILRKYKLAHGIK